MGHATVRRALGLAGLLTFVLLLATACGGGDDGDGGEAGSGGGGEQTSFTIAADGDPEPGGAVEFGLEAETDGWDPVNNRWAASGHTVALAVFDPLAAYDEEGEPQPYLAQDLVPNDDFTSWDIVLRPDITFHNGQPLNADAVVKLLRAHLDSTLTAPALEPVASVDPVDPLTVRVRHEHAVGHLPGGPRGPGRVRARARAARRRRAGQPGGDRNRSLHPAGVGARPGVRRHEEPELLARRPAVSRRGDLPTDPRQPDPRRHARDGRDQPHRNDRRRDDHPRPRGRRSRAVPADRGRLERRGDLRHAQHRRRAPRRPPRPRGARAGHEQGSVRRDAGERHPRAGQRTVQPRLALVQPRGRGDVPAVPARASPPARRGVRGRERTGRVHLHHDPRRDEPGGALAHRRAVAVGRDRHRTEHQGAGDVHPRRRHRRVRGQPVAPFRGPRSRRRTTSGGSSRTPTPSASSRSTSPAIATRRSPRP
ncbi:MAG: ABC transporter substrate-binding protein [Acidimicrobiia bacterium]|nr:ABC transporter substrate-binding protein [Acidimicrobiia bacterium]